MQTSTDENAHELRTCTCVCIEELRGWYAHTV